MSEWRPVLAVKEHGPVLGVAADGTWVVAAGDSMPVGPATERRRLMSLLPLLERPYREVDAAVTTLIAPDQPGPPWLDLLRLALQWPTPYWPGRALDWVEGGFPAADLLNLLAEVKDAPRRPQPLRHRALRLWNAARS